MGGCGGSAVCTFVISATCFNLVADLYSRDFGSVFVFSCLRWATIVLILAHCLCIYNKPLKMWFMVFFFVDAEGLHLNDFGFYAIVVDLYYHVYKGHIWWYFPIRKKKWTSHLPKNWKEGIKTGATKSPNVVDLFHGGWGQGSIHFYWNLRELSINNCLQHFEDYSYARNIFFTHIALEMYY